MPPAPLPPAESLAPLAHPPEPPPPFDEAFLPLSTLLFMSSNDSSAPSPKNDEPPNPPIASCLSDVPSPFLNPPPRPPA